MNHLGAAQLSLGTDGNPGWTVCDLQWGGQHHFTPLYSAAPRSQPSANGPLAFPCAERKACGQWSLQSVAEEASGLGPSPGCCKRKEEWLEVGAGWKCCCISLGVGAQRDGRTRSQPAGGALVLPVLGIPPLSCPFHFTDKSL